MRSPILRRLCFGFLMLCWAVTGAVAQTAPAPAPPEAEQLPLSDAVAEAIRAATASGARVVVIDPAGGVTTPTAPPGAAPPRAEPTMGGPSSLMVLQSRAEQFRATLRQRLAALPVSINEVRFILRATSPDGRIMTYVEVLAWSLLLFLIGAVVERQVYGKRIAKSLVVGRVKADPQGYREKMPFLVFRFAMGVVGALVSMLVAYLLGWALFDSVEDHSIQLTIAAIYTTYFACRLVAGVWRMVLSPFLSQYRIPALSDRDARKLYRWLWILASLDISALMFGTWIADFGLNYDVFAVISGGLALLLSVGHVAMVLFNRRAISSAIRGGRPPRDVSWTTRVLSHAWAPLVILYVVFSWFELIVDLVLQHPTSLPLIIGAYGVLTAILVVYGLINFLIEQYFFRSRMIRAQNEAARAADLTEDGTPDWEDPDDGFYGRHPLLTYEALARRVAGLLALVAGAAALLLVWDQEGLLVNDMVTDRWLDVMFVLFVGYIVYHLFRIWIDRKIADESVETPEAEAGDEGGVTSASRLATLLPLFRNFILIVVVVSIALIVLMELGINVSPLFAGAGVVGLAVGFGAQTLVRDVFSGAFFLIDDAFRKGEYIDIGDVKGTVEKISVRSFQLRHHLGALNTVPFGEIKYLTNYSRDWVIMKLPLRVTYGTDVEKVRKLIKKLGQELLDDPVIGDNFIQPLKSQGVIEMQDSAMIIRVKFMTKPGDQWLVRKRVYQDIRELFAREGIHFAHREVTVRLADEEAKSLTPAQREAVAGAVQGAMEDDDLDAGGGDER